jgi:hypothetical protein
MIPPTVKDRIARMSEPHICNDNLAWPEFLVLAIGRLRRAESDSNTILSLSSGGIDREYLALKSAVNLAIAHYVLGAPSSFSKKRMGGLV